MSLDGHRHRFLGFGEDGKDGGRVLLRPAATRRKPSRAVASRNPSFSLLQLDRFFSKCIVRTAVPQYCGSGSCSSSPLSALPIDAKMIYKAFILASTAT